MVFAAVETYKKFFETCPEKTTTIPCARAFADGDSLQGPSVASCAIPTVLGTTMPNKPSSRFSGSSVKQSEGLFQAFVIATPVFRQQRGARNQAKRYSLRYVDHPVL